MDQVRWDVGEVSGERNASVIHDLEHGLLAEATLVLVRDFADQAQPVFTRRRQDDKYLGALLLDLALRVAPRAPRIEDGETVRELTYGDLARRSSRFANTHSPVPSK